MIKLPIKDRILKKTLNECQKKDDLKVFILI